LVNVCLVAQLIKKNTPPYLKMIILHVVNCGDEIGIWKT
jgi:hypothetical protein